MTSRWGVYDPNTDSPFLISRSKIDMFYDCPRCFYMDRRLKVKRPSMPGFSLNSAVDTLLKNEFDLLRKEQKPHELMVLYKIDALPFNHPDLPVWRDDVHKYIGASVVHEPTNLEVCGIVDDIWVRPNGELIIVDYKSTSTKEEISLEDKYKQGYKRQMELYQWIYRKKGFTVSNTGYFVYANATKDREKFDGRLEFEMQLISHEGTDAWVEPMLLAIKQALDSEIVPQPSETCEYCNYVSKAEKVK